ncbi:MAG: hypothetical protein PHD21_08285 [Flavobacteriales bacterium]|nr:hypothetical protein [Flavobacteriales bacterium]
MKILTLIIRLFFLWLIIGGGADKIRRTPFMQKHKWISTAVMFFLLRKANRALAR